jgi:predicted nucleotidyltransferase component of viral defense system
MISDAEIRRQAGTYGLDPMLVEKDYILGCYLHYLGRNREIQNHWVFKGGTCLKKCYFQEYRFSEDLDFTIKEDIEKESLHKLIVETDEIVQNDTGIRLDIQDPVVEMVDDEYGKESYEVRIYYRGPWPYSGSPPSIRIHLNRDELIVLPVKTRKIYHAYSDRETLPQATLNIYALEEILVEKLRAFSGQRRFAVARDIYDIYFLIENGANIEKTLRVFDKKCLVKGIDPRQLSLKNIVQKESEYKLNWQRNLEYLVPVNLKIAFQVAWERAIDILGKILK